MQHDRPDSGLWIFWPDYRLDNPFQQMVYRAFPPDWAVGAASLEAAMTAIAEGRRPVVFHLHWEDVIYRAAPNTAAADSLVDGYLTQLDAFIAAGGRFVWTVHNEAPHEAQFLEIGGKLRAALATRAHVLHMHSLIAATRMAPTLGTEASRVLVTPLGGFTGYYPDDITKEQARRYFGIADDARVFVTLGAQRSYKGIDKLLDAFAHVHEARPEARLIVAGRASHQAPGRFAWLRPGVLALPRHIEDSTVQYVLRAADFGVFAFLRVMVSSSVLLAETFGLPVIVPDLPTLREMVEPGRNGFVYPSEDVGALARVLFGSIGLSAATRDALGQGALDDIRRRDWGDYTQKLIAAALGANSSRESEPLGGAASHEFA